MKITKKRLLCIMMSIILIMGNTTSSTEIVQAKKTNKSLPSLGEVIYGFQAIEKEEIANMGSKTVLFQHQKSGAKLLFIQNDDKNRSFDVSFQAPAQNEYAINQVLERTFRAGSKTYPFKDMLSTIKNQTYSTYADTITQNNVTSYVASSLSETQLLKLSDVYLDSLFYPAFYQDKKIFDKEAWRYEKVDMNSPITIAGNLYENMKLSSKSIDNAAKYNRLKALFPGSVIPNNAVYNSDNLLKLTYDKAVKNHKTYYHPSNALIVLYGDLNYREFLKLFNNKYLKNYSQKKIPMENGAIKPSTKPVKASYDYPVSEDSDTTNASQIDYSFAITGASDEDLYGLELLTELLRKDSSIYKTSHKNAPIGTFVDINFDLSYPQPILTFTVTGADEGKQYNFKQLVDYTISTTVKEGFDKKLIEAVITDAKFQQYLKRDATGIGPNLCLITASRWASFGTLDYLSSNEKNLAVLAKKASSTYVQSLTRTYLQKNNHNAIVSTIPKAGLLEEQEAILKKTLQKKEATMSTKEKEALIQATKDFNTWNNKDNSLTEGKSLQALEVKNLPEESKTYMIEDQLIDDIRYMTAQTNVGKIAATTLKLDTTGIPQDELHYLTLFISLMGNMSTKSHTQSELNTLITKYLHEYEKKLNPLKLKGDYRLTPYLDLSWYTLEEDYETSVKLIMEMLTETDFSKTSELLNIVKSLQTEIKTTTKQSPTNLMLNRNLASRNEKYQYLSYTQGVEYYNFLQELTNSLKDSPKNVIAHLEHVRSILLNRNNLTVQYAGSKKSMDTFYKTIKSSTEKIKYNGRQIPYYHTLPKSSQNEGIQIEGVSTYNILTASFSDIKKEMNGSYIPLMSVILENYLIPELCDKNKAYTSTVSLTEDYISFVSYIDPNVQETFQIFEKMPEFVKNYSLTQADLDRYILKSYSIYAQPYSEISGAFVALTDKMLGKTAADRLTILKEIKHASTADFKSMESFLRIVLQYASKSTVAQKDILEANRAIYAQITALK